MFILQASPFQAFGAGETEPAMVVEGQVEADHILQWKLS